jgi:hypothetical protein
MGRVPSTAVAVRKHLPQVRQDNVGLRTRERDVVLE